MTLDTDGCRVNGAADKQELEDMECEDTSCTMFPDDDSNQILPVEQFFGNLDVVQVRFFFSAYEHILKRGFVAPGRVAELVLHPGTELNITTSIKEKKSALV